LAIDKADLLAEVDLYYWALKYRRIKGQPFTIVPPLKHVYQDPATEVFIEKAAQVFVSEYLVNLALFIACTGWAQRGNALYIFPYTPQISDFSNARVEPEILSSPLILAQRKAYKERTGSAPVNNIQLKQFDKGFIYFRGSTQRQQIISVDADGVIYDEVDEMTEGTIEAGKKRATSSLIPIYRGASTPKYPKLGIDALMERSDRKVWMVKCRKCGFQQDLAKVQDVVFDLPDNHADALLSVFPNEEKGTYCHIGTHYYVGCPKCKHVLNVWDGEWVPTHTEHVEFGGYHIPKLISNRLPFDELTKRVEKERNGQMDEIQKQEFYNSDLGLPRSPSGAQLTFQDIMGCQESAPDFFSFKTKQTPEAWETWYEFPDQINGTFIGVDVGFSVLHMCIIAFPAHNECLREISPDNYPVLVYAGSVFTKENVQSFCELDPYMSRWRPIRAVIDAMPDKRRSIELSKRYPSRVFPCSYVDWAKKDKDFIYSFNLDKNTVMGGRTETLDVVYNYIYTRRLVMPKNVRYAGGNVNNKDFGQFPQHLMNVTKIMNTERGAYEYTEGNLDDHLLHALNYAFIAAGISPLNDDELRIVPQNMGEVVQKFSSKDEAFLAFSSLRFGGAQKGGNNGRQAYYAKHTQRKVGPGFGGY